MPRSSRHKSHKQSKHSSKEAREYSDSEGDDVKMKESGSSSISGRVSKDSGHLTSGEKRKLNSQVKEGKEGKDLGGYGNGDDTEGYVSSKRRKEKAADASGGVDRWNGGDEREGVEKESKGDSLRIDGEKGSKSRETKGESKSRSSKRHESGGERKDDNVSSVVEKEGRSGTRSESKRKSEKEGKDAKELRDKERGSERDKKSLESKSNVDGDVLKKQGMQADDFSEDKQGKRSRNNAEWPLQDDVQNADEKRVRKKRESSGDVDRYHDNLGDGEERRLSSRGDRSKEGRYSDEKHKDGNYGDKYYEDVDRDDRHKDAKYREDADRNNKHQDDKYLDDGDRDIRNRDDKYRDDGDKDGRRKVDKYREDGDRDNKRRDDKLREDGERDSRRRDDKYREDGDRDSRRKDANHREDIEKENRRCDARYYDEADRDVRHKEERYREDSDRDKRHKEERYRDDYERENRHRDKQGDDVDREKRLKEAKHRDDRVSKDRSADKSDTKRLRDETDFYSRKSGMLDDSYDDRGARYKDDPGRRKASDNDDLNDTKSRGTKDQISDADKRSAGSGRVESVSDRGRSASRIVNIDHSATHSRRRRSPSSGSHVTNNQYRFSKQDESKYKDYAYEERARHSETSNRDYASAGGLNEKKLFQKDDIHFGELVSERRYRSDSRASPMPLMDKSPSSTSTDRRQSSRADVRWSLDIEESGQRSAGSRDGKEYFGREARGGREVAMDSFLGDELPQAEGDNMSVSSPFTRTGHLSSSSKSHLPPPPFRTGVDSPSPFGTSEDDSRGKSSTRHRRIGDSNMGRMQGNTWRGVPNWPSPVANGFIPFQHGPPPVGFHPVMQQYPGPPLFGVRPPMDLNHHGLPYHMPDPDRFSGHVRPMGWQNLVDDSRTTPLHGWDANNAVFGEDSHPFGRPDWDNGRNLPSARNWESSGELWKGTNSGASAEMLASENDNHLMPGVANESFAGQSPQEAQYEKRQHGLQADRSEASQRSGVLERKTPEAPKFGPEEIPSLKKKSEKDDHHLCYAYLSKLDISSDLAEPELYVQCASLLGVDQNLIGDGDESIILYMEEAVDIGKTVDSKVPSSLLFSATSDSVFQRAMTLYKKHKEDFTIIKEEIITSSGAKNAESGVNLIEETLSKEDGVAEEMAVVVDEQEQNKLSDVSLDVNVPDGFEKVEGTCPNASQNGSVNNMVDKSDDSISATSKTSMEVQVASDKEAAHNIEDDSGDKEIDSQAPTICSADAIATEMIVSGGASDLTGNMSASNIEGKVVVDAKCGPLLFSDVTEACEAVMPESIESGSVNLSRIHHSPESTH